MLKLWAIWAWRRVDDAERRLVVEVVRAWRRRRRRPPPTVDHRLRAAAARAARRAGPRRASSARASVSLTTTTGRVPATSRSLKARPRSERRCPSSRSRPGHDRCRGARGGGFWLGAWSIDLDRGRVAVAAAAGGPDTSAAARTPGDLAHALDDLAVRRPLLRSCRVLVLRQRGTPSSAGLSGGSPRRPARAVQKLRMQEARARPAA